MKGLNTAAALALSAAVAACAMQTRDETSPNYQVPVGTRIELLKPVTVPPGRTRVFFQGGREGGGAGQYSPSCNLEVREIREEPQTIRPGTFRVTRVHRAPFVEVVQRRPLRLASLRLAFGTGDGDGGDAMIAPTVHMELESAAQPQVLRLTCRGGFDDPSYAEYPTVAEIRVALGDWARLEIPDSQ